MHKLLKRQIDRYLGGEERLPDGLQPFLDAVGLAYESADAERLMVERSLELMSQELTERNNDLRAQLAERQKSEAQLEQLLSLLATTLESTADGILALDRDGRVARFNQQFIDMFHVPDNVIAFWKHDKLMEAVLSVLRDPQGFMRNVEHLCRHPEAETRDVFECVDGRVIERYSLKQPLGVDGVGRVISFRDITARVRAEEALQHEKEEQRQLIGKLEEAHNQLLQSEKMASIGGLAAGVAHEINNPIGFVSSNLGTLGGYVEGFMKLIAAYEAAEPQLAAAQREALHGLKRSLDLDYLREDTLSLLRESADGIQRVRQIVQDLKDFSHVGESDWQWSDLHKGIDSTINIVSNEIKYKADVVREYGALPQVECLPSQINQVFMNLLVNAAHAMPEGRRGTITVRTAAADDQVRIEVADTGSGIPPDILKRIFDPFFTTKPVGKGTGLGLSLSYSIVQKHGGRIEVESEPGRGTTFRVTLPVKRQEQAAAEATRHAAA
jgi:signal transduction histidine kinase